MRRGAFFAFLIVALGGAGALAANGGLGFAGAAPSGLSGLRPPGAASAAAPARTAGSASPSPSPRAFTAASPVASPVASPAVPGASEIVAVASRAEQKMALVDPSSGKVSRSVDLGMPPQNMALAQNGRTAWVFSSKPGESDFLFVDLLKGERKDGKRLHDNPSAAAFSTDGRRAYVALAGGNDSPPAPNTIVFLDTRNNDEFGHIDVGEQSPGVQIVRRLEALVLAPGPSGNVLYAAGHESGTVWAVDAGSGGLLKQIEVGGGPTALLTDAARRRIHIIADTINEVITVDTGSQAITSRLTLPGRPIAAAIGADGTVYVAGGDSGQLWPVSPDMTQVGEPIPVGGHPAAVGVSFDGARVYVATRGDNSL